MKDQRAQEILNASAMIDVTHNGVPVYIEQIDRDGGTAMVHPVGEPENKQTVSISELVEE